MSALKEMMRNLKGDWNLMGEHERDLFVRCQAELAEQDAALRDLILELNEHHTIRDLHIDVVEAVRAGNRVLDAALPSVRTEAKP